MAIEHDDRLVTDLDPREYFQGAVQTALSNQRFPACDETVIYIVNLLTLFIRSDHLFEPGPDGFTLKPLALIYGEALEAPTIDDRDHALKRLGDISLFISGLFPHSLNRSLVDVDYYIAMGGNAYGYLADSSHVARDTRALKDVFMELANHFPRFVDILAEVGEQANLTNSSDIMRLYEVWQCTGSERIAGKLQEMGIHPIRTQKIKH